MELIKKENEKELESVLQNPFKSDKLRRISIELWNYPFVNEQRVEARVMFENDKTSGSQKFEEKDLLTVLRNIDVFLRSLWPCTQRTSVWQVPTQNLINNTKDKIMIKTFKRKLKAFAIHNVVRSAVLKLNHIVFWWYYKRVPSFFHQWTILKSVLKTNNKPS